VQSHESDTQWTRKDVERIWESVSSTLNPLKEFAVSDDRRSIRLARVGLAISAVLLVLGAAAILAFLIVVVRRVL
jgi:hypothetical protein